MVTDHRGVADGCESELIRHRVGQAGDWISPGQLQARNSRGGDGLELLRADVGQPGIRQRGIRVRDERLRGVFIGEQIENELQQGVHEGVPFVSGEKLYPARRVTYCHAMDSAEPPTWGALPCPIGPLPG